MNLVLVIIAVLPFGALALPIHFWEPGYWISTESYVHDVFPSDGQSITIENNWIDVQPNPHHGGTGKPHVLFPPDLTTSAVNTHEAVENSQTLGEVQNTGPAGIDDA
jgi:hypothetical protein